MKKVKVLHIVKVLNRGGAETMIMNIFRNIDKNKIQFDFLCLSEKIGDYEKEILELGGNIYKLPDPKEQGRFKGLKEVYKLMKKNKYDVVHSHIMFYNGFINLIAFFAGIKKRISHSHNSADLKKETILRKLYMHISRFMINTFSNVKIACGKDAGEYLYGKRRKYIIINNAIDLEKYINVIEEDKNNLMKELNIKENELIIGNVGRFDRVKNQEFLIELAKELVKQNKCNFKIILVGQGERFDFIRNKIIDENLEKYFIMTGLRKDIPIFMNIFDVFIMPSLHEGFPLVVVEALAGDNICFLSNNIPIETNIIDSRVHFFNLKDNKSDLINDIYNELENKKYINLEEELTKKGFSIKNMVKQISQIYQIDD